MQNRAPSAETPSGKGLKVTTIEKKKKKKRKRIKVKRLKIGRERTKE
jgi:hypothetical protein